VRFYVPVCITCTERWLNRFRRKYVWILSALAAPAIIAELAIRFGANSDLHVITLFACAFLLIALIDLWYRLTEHAYVRPGEDAARDLLITFAAVRSGGYEPGRWFAQWPDKPEWRLVVPPGKTPPASLPVTATDFELLPDWRELEAWVVATEVRWDRPTTPLFNENIKKNILARVAESAANPGLGLRQRQPWMEGVRTVEIARVYWAADEAERDAVRKWLTEGMLHLAASRRRGICATVLAPVVGALCIWSSALVQESLDGVLLFLSAVGGIVLVIMGPLLSGGLWVEASKRLHYLQGVERSIALLGVCEGKEILGLKHGRIGAVKEDR